ncbi:hypothetical protein Mapa_002884 [Marchantia paleacea]|nr:hypothetical protein Mapa_002884 [Marchantia paleacea]
MLNQESWFRARYSSSCKPANEIYILLSVDSIGITPTLAHAIAIFIFSTCRGSALVRTMDLSCDRLSQNTRVCLDIECSHVSNRFQSLSRTWSWLDRVGFSIS